VVGVTEFESRPPRDALVPVAVAAAVAVFVSATAPLAVLVGGAGALMLLFGAQAGNRRLVTVGGSILFLGVVAGSTSGIQARFTLLSAAAAFVALDAGEHVVGLGHDVGTNSRVRQAVLVHVGVVSVIAMLVAALSYTLYEFGPDSLPLAGLLALLFAVVFLAYSLRD
jgi:hypothetical protein